MTPTNRTPSNKYKQKRVSFLISFFGLVFHFIHLHSSSRFRFNGSGEYETSIFHWILYVLVRVVFTLYQKAIHCAQTQYEVPLSLSEEREEEGREREGVRKR